MRRQDGITAEPNRARADAAGQDGPRMFDDTLNPDDIAGSEFQDAARQPVGARPRSAVTDRHQPGTGDEETDDGLSETDEAVREAAEGIVDNANDDQPVFDEAEAPPRIWDKERTAENNDEPEDEDEEEADDEEGDEDDDDDDEEEEEEDDEEDDEDEEENDEQDDK
jgi:hypothetical protein